MYLSLKTIANWCNADYEGGEAFISSVSTDTRTIQSGALFIALKGENYDAQDFIDNAVEYGAAAVVCEKEPHAKIPFVLVKDSMSALGLIARGYRRLINPKVVAITGSVGKTTTKEMTACALSPYLTTQKTQLNYNNEVGLPLSICSLEQGCEVAVLELGMNHFGEMSRLARIAEPDIAVITNIGTMHIEHLGSREGILKAKLEITGGLKPGGDIVLNGDEPLLYSLADELTARFGKSPIYYSIHNSQCEIMAEKVEYSDNESNFTVVTGDVEPIQMKIPALGEHNVYNALAAISVASVIGLQVKQAAVALRDYKSSDMRQNIVELCGITVIKDYYNAGPESMRAVLSVVDTMNVKGKRFAAIGSMLELGSHSDEEHIKLGELIASKVNILYTYGEAVKLTSDAARNAGIPIAVHFESKKELADELVRNAREGDLILIKGSRGMRMEEVYDLFAEGTQQRRN